MSTRSHVPSIAAGCHWPPQGLAKKCPARHHKWHLHLVWALKHQHIISMFNGNSWRWIINLHGPYLYIVIIYLIYIYIYILYIYTYYTVYINIYNMYMSYIYIYSKLWNYQWNYQKARRYEIFTKISGVSAMTCWACHSAHPSESALWRNDHLPALLAVCNIASKNLRGKWWKFQVLGVSCFNLQHDSILMSEERSCCRTFRGPDLVPHWAKCVLPNKLWTITLRGIESWNWNQPAPRR